MAELCMHADLCSTLNINVGFIRLFDSINCIKNQNVWQRMSGLCPDPLESPREERGIEGGREVAWTPEIYDRLPPL